LGVRAPSVVVVSQGDINSSSTSSTQRNNIGVWSGDEIVVAPRGSWLHTALGNRVEAVEPFANAGNPHVVSKGDLHSIRSVPPRDRVCSNARVVRGHLSTSLS
jgi:hypothetical protein